MSTEQSSGSGPAQRRFFRAAVDFPVAIAISGKDASLEGNAVDLSGGGMRVITKSDLSAGQNITLRFLLPEGGREMMVRGRVVLSFFDASHQQYAHGIAFTQIAAPDQSELVEFIHELQQRART